MNNMPSNSTTVQTGASALGIINNIETIHIIGDMQNAEPQNDLDLPLFIKIFADREEELRQLTYSFFNKDEKKIQNKSIGESELAKQFAKKCQDERKIQKAYRFYSEREDEFNQSRKHIFEESKGKKDNFDRRNSFTKLNLSNEYFYCVPHGLQISAAYTRKKKKSDEIKFLPAYVAEFEQLSENIPNVSNPLSFETFYKEFLSATTIISLDKIGTEDNIQQYFNLALYVLYVCSYLNPEFINLKMLLNIISSIDELKSNNCDEYMLLLKNYLLIILSYCHFNNYGSKISIHRFVQKVLGLHVSKYDSNIHYKYYKASLEFLLKYNYVDFYFKSNSNMIFSSFITFQYAYENATTFYTFYKKPKEILLSKHLFKYGYSLKKILKNLCKKYINKFNLLHQTLLNLLLKFEFDVNNKNKITPLHVSAFKWNKHRNSLLYIDAHHVNLEIIQVLFERTVVLNDLSCSGNTPLFELKTNHNLDELVKIFDLLNCEDNKYVVNIICETVLHVAAASFHADLVKLLITKYKTNPNSQSNIGKTPLHTLISQLSENVTTNNLLRICETIMQLKLNGASLDIKDKNGMTPVEVAKSQKNDRVLSLLLFDDKYVEEMKKVFDDLGSCSKQFINKFHLVHYAITCNQLDVLNLLLQYNIDVNIKNYNQCTPLHIAAFYWNTEAIKILIQHKADINIRNNQGRKPIHYFFKGGIQTKKLSQDKVRETLRLLKNNNNKEEAKNL